MKPSPLYGLIGKTLSHSFSKKYFTKKFQASQIDARYELFELSEASFFPKLFEEYPELVGINVTIPFKQDVIPYLYTLSEEAAEIGAVNTIRRDLKGFSGFNSDIYGFYDSLTDFLGGESIQSALILGTGGSSKAVEYVLEKLMGISDYIKVSRNPKGEKQIGYRELFDIDVRSYPLIINTTPLGMYPNIGTAPDFPYDKLTHRHYVYDLIYNPQQTLLMKRSNAQGSHTLNGLPMLIGQAEKSWAYWNHQL